MGLFSIAGLAAVAFSPVLGRIIDKLVPWYAALVSTLLLIVFQAVQTGAGGISLAAVIVAILGLDIFRQTQQVSLMAAVFRHALVQISTFSFSDKRLPSSQIPEARSRINAVFVIAVSSGNCIVNQLCI